MSTWRMRPTLNQQPNLGTDPAHPQEPVNIEAIASGGFTVTESITFHVEQLVRITQGKPSRAQMVLKELRNAKLAPRPRKRK